MLSNIHNRIFQTPETDGVVGLYDKKLSATSSPGVFD